MGGGHASVAYLHTGHVHHIGFTGPTPRPMHTSMHMHTDTVIHRVDPHNADAHTNTHNYRCKYVPNHTIPSHILTTCPISFHTLPSCLTPPHPLTSCHTPRTPHTHSLSQLAGAPKVHKTDCTAFRITQENILRFQIAVDDP